MQVAEVFHSIQGEGKLTGQPSTFIRTSGCNLRCVWCDAPYTSWEPEGDTIDVDTLVEQARSFPTRYIVITGGEPMLWPEMTELTERLRAVDMHITVETAGTVHREIACDLASVSPKLSNSTPHERASRSVAKKHDDLRINVPVIQRFMDNYEHQLKFVVESANDIDEIDALLGQLNGVRPENVLLMPEGVEAATLSERAGWLSDLCKARGFRFCPRLHIMLYGNTRGT